jgi:phage shock protein A
MSVFDRFREIVYSNTTGVPDRAEDPEKLIRLMIQENDYEVSGEYSYVK